MKIIGHNKLKLIVVIALLTTTSSCLNETIVPITEPVPDIISFSNDIIPIFNENCNMGGCHNSGGIAPDLSADNAWNALSLGGYIDTINVAGSILYQKIAVGGSMSQFASEQDRVLIFGWIEKGAPKN